MDRVVYGNLDEGMLERTHLDKARALIVNSTDDRNAAAILTARQLGYAGEILALVEDPFHRQPIILAGATGAYTPRHILGAALAARASQKVSPTVADIQQLGHRLQVSEARIMRDSVLAGKTLAQAHNSALRPVPRGRAIRPTGESSSLGRRALRAELWASGRRPARRRNRHRPMGRWQADHAGHAANAA